MPPHLIYVATLPCETTFYQFAYLS